jgi:hypothetical protein
MSNHKGHEGHLFVPFVIFVVIKTYKKELLPCLDQISNP